MPQDNRALLGGEPVLPERCVALTYDDGPGPWSAELSDLLRRESVPGTFFVLGESVDQYGEVLDTHRDNGHVIGLHGDVHRAFSSAEYAHDQLERCRSKVADYVGDTLWFRPPYGMWHEPLDGFTGPVGWHTHGKDWEITYRSGQTVAGCVDTIVADLCRLNGGIALLHDFAPPTEFATGNLTVDDLDLRVVEITTLLISRLRDEGFSFVSLAGATAASAGTD